MARAISQCDQCGQVDDHPKAHIGSMLTGEVVSKHHDCLSVRERALVQSGNPDAERIITACVDGARGDKLLAVIQKGAK